MEQALKFFANLIGSQRDFERNRLGKLLVGQTIEPISTVGNHDELLRFALGIERCCSSDYKHKAGQCLRVWRIPANLRSTASLSQLLPAKMTLSGNFSGWTQDEFQECQPQSGALLIALLCD